MTAAAPTTVKVGDVFYRSWGYDQTNVNFYEVMKVTPSGKTVHVRETRQSASGDGDSVVPVKGEFLTDKIYVKRVSGGDKPYLAGDWYAPLWDGTPKYRTPYGYGH